MLEVPTRAVAGAGSRTGKARKDSDMGVTALVRNFKLRHYPAGRAKVLRVGFRMTGTTFLGGALTRLGYRTCGAVGVRDPQTAERAWPLAASDGWPELCGFLGAPVSNGPLPKLNQGRGCGP